MKIPALFVGLACSAVICLQAWTLNTVVEMKTEIASLRATIAIHINQTLAQK